MGGFVIRSKDLKLLQPYTEQNPHQSLSLLKASAVSIKSISEDEIHDKSKSDSISRSLACLQILWLLIQVVGRAIQMLPISTLEIFAVSNATCAVASYALWWHKPKDVGLPIILLSKFSNQEIENRMEAADAFQLLEAPRKCLVLYWVYCTCSVFFASLSILEWSVPFATNAEQLAWRIISILSPVLAACWLFSADADGTLENRIGRKANEVVEKTTAALYGIIRLYFIVEVFTGLRSSPLALYSTVNWSQYLPHF